MGDIKLLGMATPKCGALDATTDVVGPEPLISIPMRRQELSALGLEHKGGN